MRFSISLWIGTVLLVPVLASAQEPPPFQVKGYGVHSGSEVVYHYRVLNNSQTNINNPARAVQIEIGRLSIGSEPELTGMLHVGYPPMPDDGVTEMTAPAGWEGVVGGEEEHIRHTLWWSVTEKTLSPYKLTPGQTLTGLSVTRKNVNPTYLNSHFLIITDESSQFSGLIERDDTAPPTLTVTLSPNILWPPNEKLVPITATIMVKDDYDPAPEIKLESITANEPLEKEDIRDAQIGTDDRQFKLRAEREGKNKVGRIYTVTYSATDASGNKAMASATVTVPHDERKKDDGESEKEMKKK